jgi:excisionase family DNA binding protein
MQEEVQKADESQWMKAATAAKYLDLKLKTFQNYVSKGWIPCYRNPKTGTRRFKKDDLDAWMKEGY